MIGAFCLTLCRFDLIMILAKCLRLQDQRRISYGVLISRLRDQTLPGRTSANTLHCHSEHLGDFAARDFAARDLWYQVESVATLLLPHYM